MNSPLLVLAACFALGIALARPAHSSPPGISLLLGCGACLLGGLMALRAGRQILSLLLVLAGFVGAGATATTLFKFRFPPNHISRLAAQGADLTMPARLEGLVVSTPFRTAYGLQFDVDVERLESKGQFRPMTGRVRLRLPAAESSEAAAVAGALHLRYGDSIRAPVTLRQPRVYRNPGSFDFRWWMQSIEDIYWVGTIKSPLLVEVLPQPKAFRFGGWLEKARQSLLDGIDRLYPPWSAEGRYGAVLKAVLLGDRSSLSSDIVENFRKTGLYHLLVIAGLHVGLLAMLAAFFFRLLPLSESWRTAGVLLFLFGYAFLVEQRAPTLRATIMIAAYWLARFLYRQHAALNAVGLAALILLLHRPAWLFEAGFELSFSAALLIVALVAPILGQTTEPYRRALRQLHDVDLDPGLAPRQAQFRLDLRNLINVLKARLPFLQLHPSLAAALVTVPTTIVLWAVNVLVFSALLQLGLLLPMAETFHRVSYAGIGLNALAIPVMTLLLACALPAVFLSALAPALGLWLGKALNPVMAALFALTELPNLPAWLSYRVPEPPRWVAWGFAISVAIAAWTVGRHKRVFRASLSALAIFALLISVHPFEPRLSRGGLEVTALDCGGGQGLFVALPDRRVLLMDACGSHSRAREGALQTGRWDPGEDIVSPYLWWRGIKKLDVVLLTDDRESQLSGLAAVVRNFRISEFWLGDNPSTPGLEALLEQVGRRGIPVRQLGGGELIQLGGTSLQVLWPPASAGGSGAPRVSRLPSKDDSVILRIVHDQRSVLLPGDASRNVEDELARSASPLASEVMEIAHHSATPLFNSEFLARVSPRIVVVAGEMSHPSESLSSETLDRLRLAGSRVFRTDLEGAVTVELKGNMFAVHTYRTSAGEGTTDVASTDALTFSVP